MQELGPREPTVFLLCEGVSAGAFGAFNAKSFILPVDEQSSSKHFGVQNFLMGCDNFSVKEEYLHLGCWDARPWAGTSQQQLKVMMINELIGWHKINLNNMELLSF